MLQALFSTPTGRKTRVMRVRRSARSAGALAHHIAAAPGEPFEPHCLRFVDADTTVRLAESGIRTVLWAAGLYLVTAPLWLLLLVPGWIAWGVISIWFLYRIVRGWMSLNANQPMPR